MPDRGKNLLSVTGHEENSLAGSFWVLGLTICWKWSLSPWGLGKCWVLFCKTCSSNIVDATFLQGLYLPLCDPHSKWVWPQELVQRGQECVQQPSFRGAGVGPRISLLAHQTGRVPAGLSPWCLLLPCRCFWGSPPRFTAVTLILMSGSVFGGAQTQPHWVSSCSMGTKLDALHSWLDAGHGHPFWLAVGCGHSFRTAVAGSGFCV